MLDVTVNVSGKSVSDLVEALREVTRRVDEEYTSGFDRNESGNFNFDVSGEPEPDEDEDEEED